MRWLDEIEDGADEKITDEEITSLMDEENVSDEDEEASEDSDEEDSNGDSEEGAQAPFVFAEIDLDAELRRLQRQQHVIIPCINYLIEYEKAHATNASTCEEGATEITSEEEIEAKAEAEVNGDEQDDNGPSISAFITKLKELSSINHRTILLIKNMKISAEKLRAMKLEEEKGEKQEE